MGKKITISIDEEGEAPATVVNAAPAYDAEELASSIVKGLAAANTVEETVEEPEEEVVEAELASDEEDAVEEAVEANSETSALNSLSAIREALSRIKFATPESTFAAKAEAPLRFRSVLAVEGERTADNRMLAPGSLTWRNPPLPLMLMVETDEGHDGARVAAVIEDIYREGSRIIGEGRFDTGTDGQEAQRLVNDLILTGVSVDLGDLEYEVQIEEVDEDGYPTKVLYYFTSAVILGATIVPFPAIASTTIETLDATATVLASGSIEVATDEDAETIEDADGVEELSADGVQLSEEEGTPGSADEVDGAAGGDFSAGDGSEEQGAVATEGAADSIVAAGPIVYDAASFSNPEFTEPTAISVDEDGHVSGHAALWGTCHIGFPGCVTAPRSHANYSYFQTGAVKLTDGETLPVGVITMDAMHAHTKASAKDASRHYDHTGSAVAYVVAGEDEFGVWVSGVLKPGVSDEVATHLQVSSLSGDWRRIAGNLELVALLAVNVPGFPVARVEQGERLALVAAGYGHALPVLTPEVSEDAEALAADECTDCDENTTNYLAQLIESMTSINERLSLIESERAADLWEISDETKADMERRKAESLLARIRG